MWRSLWLLAVIDFQFTSIRSRYSVVRGASHVYVISPRWIDSSKNRHLGPNRRQSRKLTIRSGTMPSSKALVKMVVTCANPVIVNLSHTNLKLLTQWRSALYRWASIGVLCLAE